MLKSNATAHSRSGKLCAIILFCIAALLFAGRSYAQTAGTASLQGTITDSTGAVIPNAAITLTNTATQVVRKTTSDGSGLYSFPNTAIGTYSLGVTVAGFQSYKQTNIVLEVGSSIAVNVKMTIGEATQQIEVKAEGLALQTEDSSYKQTIDSQTVTEMPLNDRLMTDLITLSGAATVAPGSDMTTSKNFPTSKSISIAGGAGNQTTYRLDGGDNNDYMTNVNLPFPFPDAVNQFSVETAVLGAQGGSHPGGLVNVVTKSGTNQWHGNAFEFIRNNIIDASSFFSTTPDKLHQDFWGGTIGGPAIHDKLFFFVGYQHLHLTSNANNKTAYVPTAANLAGDFSVTDSSACTKGASQLVDPFTGAKLTNNHINPAEFSKAALATAKYLPISSADQCGAVSYSIPSAQFENQFITREDWTISPKHTLYGRYFLDGYDTPAYFYPTNILVTTSPGTNERVQTLTLGETWTISSRTVNLFHATGLRRRDDRGPATGINPSTVGINVYSPYQTTLQLSISSKFGTYCGICAPAVFNDNTFSFADDLNLVRGKHQIVLGGEYVRNQLNISNAYQSNGSFSFSGQFGQYGPSGSPSSSIPKGATGNDANLDFLTGAMSGMGQSRQQQNALRAPIPSLYVQDTYHANHRVVLAGGVRWVPEFEPFDYFNRGSQFSYSDFLSSTTSGIFPNAPAGILFYGDKGVPRAFTKNSIWQFSPNIGITFDPTGTGNTVFRAGTELAYDEPNFFTGQRVNQNPPFATATENQPVGQPLSYDNPYSSGSITPNPYPLPVKPTAATASFPNGSQYISLPTQFKPSYTIQWTASMQQELAHGWQFQLQYIGNRSVHMANGYPLSPAVYIPGTYTGPGSCGSLAVSPGMGKPCSSTGNQAARFRLTLLNPTQGPKYAGGGGGSVLIYDSSFATYHAMVTTVQHRMSRSFSLLANYTWSKCLNINDASGDIGGSTGENPNNLKLDYGPCGSDIRNVFNTTLVSSSHFALSGWKSALVNNWQIAPLFVARSGTPFTVSTGQDISLTAEGQDRPNLVNKAAAVTPKTLHRDHTERVLNINAFSLPALGTYGNLGRNTFRGFKYVNLDTEVSRMFPIHERLNLDLRLEAFNVLNHPNFSNPASDLNKASTFGEVTGSSGARVFQGAVKLIF